MRWYIVTLVLSIEVQKEKIAKPQTQQTVAPDKKEERERYVHLSRASKL